jgi:hypothetical protein
MFVHLEQALIEIEFLDQHNPKKLMSRLRRLFARTSLTQSPTCLPRNLTCHDECKQPTNNHGNFPCHHEGDASSYFCVSGS